MIRTVAVVSVLCAAGCLGDERHIGWERERAVIGPVALKDRVAYIDGSRDRVVVIDTSEAQPRLHSWDIGRRAMWATTTPDQQRLAVITRGEEALQEGQVDERPALYLIDVTTPGSVPVAYPIGSPFDRLAIAADGSLAVAYFSTGGPDSDGVFRNPNELAVIDLVQGPSAGDPLLPDNPVLRTVRSFGSAPDGVVLSPPMAVPGAEDPTPRIFAFVLALDNVTILDATYPERREVSIRLDGTGAAVRPREVVFAPNTASAYLRSDNARDVLAILLSYDPPGDSPTDNDFQPALAELGAGGGPADVAVYDDSAGRRFVLAATPNTYEVAIIDADTAAFSTVRTPDPIDRVLLFPDQPDVAPRIALLASLNQRVPRVHLLSLDGIDDDLVAVNLRTVELTQPVLDVVPVPGRDLAMIVHDDNRTVLGLLDVAFGSVSPLEGVGRLDTYDFSPTGDYLVGATSGVDRVGFVELANLHPHDLRLDAPPMRVFALAGGRIFVDHGDPFGRATVLPGPLATREQATLLSGFLLTDLFGQEF